ncbi:MAG: hypothetical protein IKX51_07830 [Bacteroidales bacterium]|nr:hypothetical protein [Bacteroidales bacterium]
MKKVLFIVVACCLLNAVQSTERDTVPPQKKWGYSLSGFVSPQLFYDTRQVVSGREDMMLFYPKPIQLDANGNDINATPNLNMLAISTRLALSFWAPDVLGAKTSAYIEGDFTGATDASINLLRLRHAYIDMKWRSTELLMGQYWHPMVVHEIMPGTRPLNMGAPFHPYARFVQTRLSQRIGNVELLGVAAFQLDNKSAGPDGGSTKYLKATTIPELNFQMRYRGQRLFLGAAYHLLVIKPRLSVTDSLGHVFKATATVPSQSFTVFGKYDFQRFSLKSQVVWGNNLSSISMMGGYIESPFDETTKSYSYTPFGCTTAWVDFGKSTGKWRYGIFMGYGVNNDFGKTLEPGSTVYGRGFEIESLWRVQPRIAFYPREKFGLFFEVEHTNVNYGIKDLTLNKYVPDHKVANTRFILSAIYNF